MGGRSLKALGEGRSLTEVYMARGFFILVSTCTILLTRSMGNLSNSVSELNAKVAVIIEQVSQMTAVNKDFETRLRRLEKRR